METNEVAFIHIITHDGSNWHTLSILSIRQFLPGWACARRAYIYILRCGSSGVRRRRRRRRRANWHGQKPIVCFVHSLCISTSRNGMLSKYRLKRYTKSCLHCLCYTEWQQTHTRTGRMTTNLGKRININMKQKQNNKNGASAGLECRLSDWQSRIHNKHPIALFNNNNNRFVFNNFRDRAASTRQHLRTTLRIWPLVQVRMTVNCRIRVEFSACKIDDKLVWAAECVVATAQTRSQFSNEYIIHNI